MKRLDERNAPLAFQYNILEQDRSKLREGVLMKIGGVYQRADIENANKRIYPRELWMDVLQRPDLVERIENRRMVGTLGHPASGVTDPDKVSHVVTAQELRSDGTIYGESEVLDTPQGQIAATMMKAGIGLGISSRGDGSIEKKGDKNEVQNDYKLETYDLVLKPSTSGAYPGMLAESTVEENESLVAEAIEGLVNSETIPAEQRMPVLTECLKILGVLEAENSGDRIQTVSSKITEEIEAARQQSTTPVVVVRANESVQPGFNPITPEDTMNVNPNTPPQQPQLPPDTLAWHQSMVNYAVGQANAAKESEISSLKDTLIKAQREHTETKQRLKAAEGLIEDFTKKITDLEESGPADQDLLTRYNAAVELLDEAIKRLPEVGTLGKRVETLEGICQASIDYITEDRITTAVNTQLENVDQSFHATIRPILENCQTPEQVGETFKAFMAVSNGTPVTQSSEPLPNSGPVNENNNNPKPQPPPQKNNLVEMLGARLKRAV